MVYNNIIMYYISIIITIMMPAAITTRTVFS